MQLCLWKATHKSNSTILAFYRIHTIVREIEVPWFQRIKLKGGRNSAIKQSTGFY
jgi:hypothetical protein